MVKKIPKSYQLNFSPKISKKRVAGITSGASLSLKTKGRTFMNKKNVMDVSAGLRAAKKLGQKLQ